MASGHWSAGSQKVVHLYEFLLDAEVASHHWSKLEGNLGDMANLGAEVASDHWSKLEGNLDEIWQTIDRPMRRHFCGCFQKSFCLFYDVANEEFFFVL